MNIVITGGAGFIGRKLIQRLLADGDIKCPDGAVRPVEKVIALDVVELPADEQADPRVESYVVDVSDRDALRPLIPADTNTIYHLAAIVSGDAEENFDLGYRINLMGTLNILEIARELGTVPTVIFSSSVAAYGGDDLPKMVGDDTPITPQTSYGAQKVMGEYMVTG